METDEITTKKRSLGALRKAQKTKLRSPDAVGTLKLQRTTFETISKQFEETDSDEIEVCIAGWFNTDKTGSYLTIEISPKFVRRQPRPAERTNLSWVFEDPEEA